MPSLLSLIVGLGPIIDQLQVKMKVKVVQEFKKTTFKLKYFYRIQFVSLKHCFNFTLDIQDQLRDNCTIPTQPHPNHLNLLVGGELLCHVSLLSCLVSSRRLANYSKTSIIMLLLTLTLITAVFMFTDHQNPDLMKINVMMKIKMVSLKQIK